MTKEKLIALWNRRNDIFNDEKNKKLIERFDQTEKLFDDLLKLNVEIDRENNIINIDGKQLENAFGYLPTVNRYFAVRDDEMTDGGAFLGVNRHAEAFPDYSALIRNVGSMLGGFDYIGSEERVPAMREEYRIISNRITSNDDNGSLISYGQTRHPSSHFADNNYFFEVASEVRKMKDGSFKPQESHIVLRWPSKTYYAGMTDEAIEESQKRSLRHRFPYKYFYMWANKERMVHLLSLAAYKSIVAGDDDALTYKSDTKLGQTYEDFVTKWQEFSDKLIEILPEEEREKPNFIRDFSKFLSIILLIEQDSRSVLELLCSGNHAIVLYGPPGTGKTFLAKDIASQLLGIDKEAMSEYQFIDNESVKPAGAWQIVQFHPGYSYEDFIGGIMPRLDDGSLSYPLKEGAFKKLCDSARQHPDAKFVMIIDEINRADLSAVFGELMYGIEYRDELIEIPNFNEKFCIPSNVYIIGTMNSIDKSLVTFDIALRRRFGFHRMMPALNVLPKILENNGVEENNLAEFVKRCKKLNNLLCRDDQLGLNPDYQIGQAYFGKIKDFIPKSKDEEHPVKIDTYALERLWIYHILPLLEEYLGNRANDMSDRLENIKKDFIKPLES